MEVRNMAKYSLVEAMLEVGEVRLGVNPELDEVVIPVQMRGRAYVALRLGEEIPMFNLSMDDHGLSATLTFDEVPFDTYVPWAAVFAVSTKYGELQFHEDFPRALSDDGVEPQAIACAAVDSFDAVTEFDVDVPTQTGRTRPEWLSVVP